MGRFSSNELFEEYASERAPRLSCEDDVTRSPAESYIALSGDSDDVATRFARPSAPAMADSDEVETRYGQSVTDSDDVATRFARPSARPAARPVTHAFVAPAEIEGDRSPSMRARRQSHVAPSERRSAVPPPPRPSHAELERRSRASFVANSERNDFASSVPDVEEVTSFREPPRKSHVALSDSIDGHYSSSEIEELQPAPSVDYKALNKYLFEDISTKPSKPTPPHKTTNPAFPPPPHASSFMPPPPAKRTHQSFAPAAHAQPAYKATHQSFMPPPPAHKTTQPAFAPAPGYSHTPSSPRPAYTLPVPPVSPSSSTPVAPVMQRQHMRTGMPVQHDSYIDSSWIVPTSAFPQPAPAARHEGFRFTLGFLAAAITATAALIVIIGAVIFVRSDDASSLPAPTFAMRAPLDEPAALPPAAPTPAPTQVEAPAAKATTPAALKDVAPKAEKIATKPKKKTVTVAATDDDGDDTPVATKPTPKAEKAAKAEKTAKKATGKVGDQTVEQMLADLGEEQLRR